MNFEYLSNDDALQVIVKISGGLCNMNCTYCYEKRRIYDEDSIMDPNILDMFLTKMNKRKLSIQLHGGEPLLVGIEKMKRYFDIIKKYKGNVKLNIQTNGLLLNEDWFDFFNREWPDIEIGISIDGDEETNCFRIDYNNNSTFKKIENILKLADEYKIRIGVIAVVNSKSITKASNILSFYSKYQCIKTINFTPCFDYNIGNSEVKNVPVWAITPKQYTDFIINIYNEWINKKYYNNFIIEPIFSIIRVINGKCTSLCHFNNRKCAHMMTLYPNGLIGSCDELYMLNSYYYNIKDIIYLSEFEDMQRSHELFKQINDIVEKCKNCDYSDLCKGGCCATRLNYNSHLEEEYCEQRKQLIEFIKLNIESINKI